jgi:hypothetical protein
MKEIRLFGSYAHDDDPLASELMDALFVHLQSAKGFTFSMWTDRRLMLGDEWDPKIKEEMEASDGGLLLVSPTFVTRPYIQKFELPHFLTRKEKVALPVLLRPVDLSRQTLLGLEDRQIYSLNGKAYSQLDAKGKERFVLELFRRVYDRFQEVFACAARK